MKRIILIAILCTSCSNFFVKSGEDVNYMFTCGWKIGWWQPCKNQAKERCPNGYSVIAKYPTGMPLGKVYLLDERQPYSQNRMIVKCK